MANGWKRLVLTIVVVAVCFVTKGQDVTGIWRGHFTSDYGDQYKYEVQIGQSKKGAFSGVTYSYLDTRFYGKATITGKFRKGCQSALVQEIKTVELRMSGGSSACIMKCKMIYSKSGQEEFLEGIYTSAYEKTDSLQGIKRGQNAGGGRVYLRKVTTSEFYVEPSLRNKIKTPAPTIETATLKPTVKPPVAKPVVKKTTAQTQTVAKKPITQTIAKKPDNRPVIVDSTTRRKTTQPVVINTPPVVRKLTIPVVTRDRKNELTKTIGIINNEIEISLYDNGDIDDDTISIYLDGALLMSNKRLSNKPISYKLKMDDKQGEHVMVMVAENLGRIPPNTSLMIINDGDKRYQVSITSTEQKNAMVRFRYEGNSSH